MTRATPRWVKETATALSALAIALLLRLLLDDVLGAAQPYVFLYGAIAICAALVRWQVGAGAVLLGWLATQQLVVAARSPVLDAGNLAGGLAYAAACAVILAAGAMLRRQPRNAVLEELREAEERIRSVVDHVLDGIITIDERGRVTTFNRAAERIFGYAAREMIGENVKKLMPEPYRAEHDGYVRNYLETGHAKIIGVGREVVGRRKDGVEFPMELAISEFRLHEQRYFTGIVRDITERKRLESELQQRLQDLAAADRQKNEFLAMLGHELRNPLGPMSNALYLMKRAPADASAQTGAQAMIERQLQHLVRLVDDLLDISRIVQGKIELRRECIALVDAVRRAAESSQPAIDANGHELELALPDEPIYVMGDLVRLAQAISNVLNNAAKYSMHPGRIHLELRREGAQAVIAVRDEGTGMPAELLPRVFELFVQGEHNLARSRGGLGIGLTLVRRVIEMHNGCVSAASAGPGRGSEFVLRLPAIAPPAAQAQSGRRGEEAATPAARRRVLVVDDNVDAAQSMATILRLFGHEVRCVHDGPAGLAEALQFSPDVVVLDIGLPGLDGYEIARRLRAVESFRRTVLIAVTGYGQREDRRRSREAGFDAHMTKPVDPEVLGRVVATMVGEPA